jgi:hypothetical protein
MFIPLRTRPCGGGAAHEIVAAREELEEKPVVFRDGVGVLQDRGPPLKCVGDGGFGEGGEREGRPECGGAGAKVADVFYTYQPAGVGDGGNGRGSRGKGVRGLPWSLLTSLSVMFPLVISTAPSISRAHLNVSRPCSSPSASKQ